MPPSNSTQASGLGTSDNHAGAIAGGLIGGLAGLALLATAIWFFMKRRKRSKMPPSVAYLRSSRNLTDAISRGHYAPVVLKNEQGAPFLPISIVRSSEDRSSMLFVILICPNCFFMSVLTFLDRILQFILIVRCQKKPDQQLERTNLLKSLDICIEFYYLRSLFLTYRTNKLTTEI
jgi:hypothetical protein